jgi:hypothetical protein
MIALGGWSPDAKRLLVDGLITTTKTVTTRSFECLSGEPTLTGSDRPPPSTTPRTDEAAALSITTGHLVLPVDQYRVPQPLRQGVLT